MTQEKMKNRALLHRVPLIPEYNKKEDQAESAALLRSMGVTRLDLFDYVIREEQA